MRYSKFFIFTLCSILLFGCEKKEKMDYQPIGAINGLMIKDIVAVDSTTLAILGEEDDKSVVYTYNVQTKSSKKGLSRNNKYNALTFSDGMLWLCGDKMNIRMSADTGKTILEDKDNIADTLYDFSYWDEWESEKSNLVKMFVTDGKPMYAIGKRDMLLGNFYRKRAEYANNIYYPFYGNSQSSSDVTGIHVGGLNDMVLYNNSEVYVAGYGSILHVTNEGKTIELEDVGDENFTSISISNDEYLFACTYSGKVYRSKIGSGEWKKMYNCDENLLFIKSDDYGNVLAMGESKIELISTDNGETWREEKYDEGRKVSCLVVINNTFYIGTEKGVIHYTNDNLLQLNLND